MERYVIHLPGTFRISCSPVGSCPPVGEFSRSWGLRSDRIFDSVCLVTPISPECPPSFKKRRRLTAALPQTLQQGLLSISWRVNFFSELIVSCTCTVIIMGI